MTIDWDAYGIDLGRYRGMTSGGWKKVLCPRCSADRKKKREPVLRVNLDDGGFKCMHCGWKGKATVLTQEDKEEFKRMRGWDKVIRKEKEKKKQETYKLPPQQRRSALHPSTVEWFAGRGISERTLKAAGVTDGIDWMFPNYKTEERMPDGGKCRCIHFNYYRDGQLVNIKKRSKDKMFMLVKDCERIAYNLDGIKNTEECYIVEGEMDALALMEVGYNNVISVPVGAMQGSGGTTEMHWLEDYFEDYFAFKSKVYICTDNDEPGAVMREAIIKHFDPGQYVIVTDYGTDPATGKPNKDANDCLMHNGAIELRRCLDSGKEKKPEGDVDMDTVADEMDDIIRHGLPKGLPVGLPNLDSLLRVQKGRLYILTGTPGSGKSQFLDHVAVLMNARYGWKFSVYSPEMMPLGEHLTMFLTKYLGKPVSQIDPDSAEYHEGRHKVKEAVHFIDPDSNEIDDVLAIAKYQCRKYGCEAIIIDPWNSLLHHGESLFKVDNINEALLKILNFAHRQDIAAFVMPHPTNQQTTKDGKPMKIHLYNISGGAMFRNRGDFGMVMTRHYKDDDDNTFGFDYVEMAIEKTKWEYIAQLGTIYFRYEPGVGRFHPFDPATGETQWMQQSYLVPTQQPLTLPTAAPAAQPSEGNVQAFLDQARRQEQALQPRPTDNDLPVDNENDIFDDNEEVPY